MSGQGKAIADPGGEGSGARTAVGVLLVNLGSPDAPTPRAVRKYLKEFLWDPRVVDLPRPLWWMILNGIILNTRPRRSARLYAEVWTDEGAPLSVISRRQMAALAGLYSGRAAEPVLFDLGMRYGSPSILEALESLRERGCGKVLVVPLYPQYSCTTTATVFDAVADVLRGWRDIPELRLLHDYHDHPGYIEALASSVRESWADRGRPDRLLMSFHGLPRRYADTGDPYPRQCRTTARLLADALGLGGEDWELSFQSRFGREEWLKPYTDETLKDYGRRGIRRVDVICPGFAADCLETLEEIAVTNKAVFLTAGGERYHYIAALNDREGFIAALAGLIDTGIAGWEGTAAAGGAAVAEERDER